VQQGWANSKQKPQKLDQSLIHTRHMSKFGPFSPILADSDSSPHMQAVPALNLLEAWYDAQLYPPLPNPDDDDIGCLFFEYETRWTIAINQQLSQQYANGFFADSNTIYAARPPFKQLSLSEGSSCWRRPLPFSMKVLNARNQFKDINIIEGYNLYERVQSHLLRVGRSRRNLRRR
jgi:hypothetical protein